MYGVLLWEILTFAREQPFENLTDEKVVENIGHIFQDNKKHVSYAIICNYRWLELGSGEILTIFWTSFRHNELNYRFIYLENETFRTSHRFTSAC